MKVLAFYSLSVRWLLRWVFVQHRLLIVMVAIVVAIAVVIAARAVTSPR